MARAQVTDLVVVLPGILGSRLADADGRAVWDLSGPALLRGLRSFGRSVGALRLPKDIGDGDPGDGVVPVGLMPDLHALPGIWHPVDGYTDLLRWLERHFTLSVSDNLLTFPYDWRLSCRHSAGRLKGRIDLELERWRASAPERREARVVFLCHGMGGLVARHYVERLGGHAITRRVITLGTPHRGSVRALADLVEGGHSAGPGLGPFARSLPSLHQLAPDYACVEGPDGLAHLRDLPGLPGVDEALLADAARFHADLRSAPPQAGLYAIAGTGQPTATTARYAGGRLTLLPGADGDGTVPRLGAASGPGAPYELCTPYEQHGSLQNNRAAREALRGLLGDGSPLPETADGVDRADGAGGADGPDPAARLGVQVVPVLPAGVPYEVVVTAPDDARLPVAELRPADGGRPVARALRSLGGGRHGVAFPPPEPGAYRLSVGPVTALSVIRRSAL
ncbi:lipase family alpha/beta hydrolase [Streptomyces sp. NPDC051109]|uniref:lipase family alpha/beta hydrolase n=1 Tax=Streptomyces sp. NPDC051109 TaxID=3365642 RepID=UPI00379654DE